MSEQLKILFLSSSEYGDMISGVGVIITNTLRCLASMRVVDSALGVFRPSDLFKIDVSAHLLPPVKKVINIAGAPLNKLQMLRGMLKISAPDETSFLQSVSRVSDNYGVAIWFGSAYDPVSLKLPAYCRCPLLFHITDSISLHQERQITKRLNKIRNWAAKLQERQILAAEYARVIYVSKEDYETGIQLAAMKNSAKVLCLPIGVDLKTFCPRSSPKTSSGKMVILFTGVMYYQPNVDAALYLIREIMPKLHNNIELRIVGREPVAAIVEAAKTDDRIVVTGAVRDIVEEHQNADIFIAPMISGAGIKIKILQAMSCGLPVVATSVCVRAFPEIPAGILAGDTVEQIVNLVGRLIGNEAERRELGRNGRIFVEKNWSWAQRTEKLVRICSEIKDHKK